MNGEFPWTDRRRRFGLPLSFTKYRLGENLLMRETGLFSLHEEDIQLYRIMDIETSKPFGQRIFGCGTVTVHSSDKTSPVLELKSIKNPDAVKSLLYEKVEEAKTARRMRTTELLDTDGDEFMGGDGTETE